MRSSLAAAAMFLLGLQALPAVAGVADTNETAVSCAVLAGQTALPTGLCQHLAAVILTPGAHMDASDLLADNPAAPLLARLPMAATSPMAPGMALKTSAAWQSHLDQGVSNYHQIFNGQGLTYALPAAPSVLWPGGNPFASQQTD